MSINISQRQHLMNAALLWIMVGVMLGIRGSLWMFADLHLHHLLAIILPLAVVLGLIKGSVLLRNSAHQAIARIMTLNKRTPFWMLFHPSSYLLIIGMMGFGVICRMAGRYWHIMGIIGFIYLIVGIALITGSLTYWSRYVKLPDAHC